MTNRVINYEKCISCGLCVSDCIARYIVFDEEPNSPSFKKAKFKDRGRCINCGHCNAICPSAAISVVEPNNFDIDDDMLNLMSHKRSVRSYIKNKTIDKKILDKIILSGYTAPTDRNRKSARIIFIKEKLKEIYTIAVNYLWNKVKNDGTINPIYILTKEMYDNIGEVLWDAEYLVVFVGLHTQLTDSAIASERMQLLAEKLGVASAYRGDMVMAINECEELKNILNVKPHEEALVSFALGYGKYKYLRPAVKVNRVVEFL